MADFYFAVGSDYQPTDYDDIKVLVARALLHGNKVVINADW